MYKDEIIEKIKELESEKRKITSNDYHRQQYKKLLEEKIQSYKRLLPEAKRKKEMNPLDEVFGKNPHLRGDGKKGKKGRYTTL